MTRRSKRVVLNGGLPVKRWQPGPRLSGATAGPSVIETTAPNEFLSAEACPECDTGILVQRINRKKGKYFYGCSQYPECTYASDELPSAENDHERDWEDEISWSELWGD